MIFKPKNKNQIITVKTLSDLCDSVELEQEKNKKVLNKKDSSQIKKEYKPEIIPEPQPIINDKPDDISEIIPETITEIKQDTSIEKIEKVEKPKSKLTKVGVKSKSKSGSDIKWL